MRHTLGFPGGTSGKRDIRDIRDSGLTPGWERTLEKGMATPSSILAWRIPRTEEPGGLQSTGLHRVGHDRSDLAHTHTPSCLHFLPAYFCFYIPMFFEHPTSQIALTLKALVSFPHNVLWVNFLFHGKGLKCPLRV